MPARHDYQQHWSIEKSQQLEALWAEGHSSAEIGRRMGITKNMVIGRAHRLHLPQRPSPIKHGGGPRVRPQRAPKLRLVGVTQDKPPPAPVVGSRGKCQWIHDSGPWLGRDPLYCGAPYMAGLSYCGEHCARCFTNWHIADAAD